MPNTGSLAPYAFVLIVGIMGYAIGSISSGYIVGKAYRNVDLRRVGSGSTGATNTLRHLGPGAALTVGVLDILKGAVAVLVANVVFPVESDFRMLAQACAATGAIAGHCWPAFLEGRGGRGVATGLGTLIVIANPAWIASVVAFVVAIAVTRMVSVGSLAATFGAIVAYFVLVAAGVMSFHWAMVAFMATSATIVVLRHRANIARILRGSEPRLGRR